MIPIKETGVVGRRKVTVLNLQVEFDKENAVFPEMVYTVHKTSRNRSGGTVIDLKRAYISIDENGKASLLRDITDPLEQAVIEYIFDKYTFKENIAELDLNTYE